MYTDRNILAASKQNSNRSRFGWVRVDFLVGPLMLAAAEVGNTKRFISTLEYIRNINFEDDRKETALHKAACKGYDSIIQNLLTKGASIEAMNEDNHTPLHHAARNGHTSTVELLLMKGASIGTIDKDAETPLHFAARNGHTNTVELLLGKGASIEAMNKHNKTPLQLYNLPHGMVILVLWSYSLTTALQWIL